MIYFGTRLSENISRREPEGYLICLNVPVARTGAQDYLPSELGLPGPDDHLVPVLRPPEEVFAPACLASFEGMPVTDDHPSAPEGVTLENIRFLQKGHAHNVRRGGPGQEDLLLADLIVTDPRLIDEILAGKREISCGYNYVLCEEDGRYLQREIRGNHVAVVDSGRAGPRVSIQDRRSPRRPNPQNERSTPMKPNARLFASLLTRMARDGDTEALAQVISALTEEPAAENAVLPAAPVIQAAQPALPAVPVIQAAQPAPQAAVPAEAAPAPQMAPAAVLPAQPLTTVPVIQTATGQSALQTAMPAVPAAPVVVDPPADQPVLVDCGPEILSALREIIALLTGSGADCADPARQRDQDPDPAAAAEAVTAELAAQAASAISEAAENTAAEAEQAVSATAEAVAEAVAESLGVDPAPEEDPVEALVAEILEPADPAAGEPREEILSTILSPEADEDPDAPDDPNDPDRNARAADALRAALAAFRPQLRRMSPKDRQRFNADVAARMRRLTRQVPGRPSPYAALRQAAARDRSGKSLGEKIMASRNANRK